MDMHKKKGALGPYHSNSKHQSDPQNGHTSNNSTLNDNKNESLSFKNESWGQARDKLQAALNIWDELSSINNTLSPDEKKLKEMKSLIEEIKHKMDEF